MTAPYVFGAYKNEQLKKFKACENVTMAALARDGRKILAHTIRLTMANPLDSVGLGFGLMKGDGSIKSISMARMGKHFGTSDIVGDVYLWGERSEAGS